MINVRWFPVLILFIFFCSTASAQSPGDLIWESSLGGSDDEAFSDIVQTPDGGYVTVGFTCTFGTTLDVKSLWLVKVDNDGNGQWHQTYGGADSDEGQSIALTSDGGFIIAGSTYSLSATLKDGWILKTDANGNIIWTVVYDGGSYDNTYAVIENSDGDYVAAGYSVDNQGFRQVLLIKIDASGNIIWDKTYGGLAEDQADSLVQTSDGGYAICGFTDSMGAGGDDVLLMKFDSDGNELWSTSFGSIEDDRGYAVQEVPGGDLVLSGSSGPLTGDRDLWMARTDANGNAVWEKTLPGSLGWDQANDVKVAPDGGFVFVGFVDAVGSNGDQWVVKTEGSGNVEWQEFYGGTGFLGEVGVGVCLDRDGNIVTTGQNPGGGFFEMDGWIVKIHGGLNSLIADAAEISASTGATVTFTLSAGAAQANRPYLLAGTASGTDPGTLLPGGLVTIPLNRDYVTNYILAHMGPPSFIDFSGNLDGTGQGTAQLVVGPLGASWIGTTLHFAYAHSAPWDFASKAVEINIVP